jgi:hypothetical protein
MQLIIARCSITICVAVLQENYFTGNEEDLDVLQGVKDLLRIVK